MKPLWSDLVGKAACRPPVVKGEQPIGPTHWMAIHFKLSHAIIDPSVNARIY